MIGRLPYILGLNTIKRYYNNLYFCIYHVSLSELNENLKVWKTFLHFCLTPFALFFFKTALLSLCSAEKAFNAKFNFWFTFVVWFLFLAIILFIIFILFWGAGFFLSFFCAFFSCTSSFRSFPAFLSSVLAACFFFECPGEASLTASGFSS